MPSAIDVEASTTGFTTKLVRSLAMQYDINTLPDFLHQLPEHIENTKQFITKTDIWLINPNLNEVPVVEGPGIMNAITNIVQHGRTYIENVSTIFEVIKFVVKWPNI